MEMIEIIERVSRIYRDERRKVSDLYEELTSINRKIYEAEKGDWETITVAEYKKMNKRKESIEDEIHIREAYCEGISCVREMLMDLGFDTEIS